MNQTQKDILKAKRSKWTKKDYEMVAKIIRGTLEYKSDYSYDVKEKRVIYTMAYDFAATFTDDSPLFDRERFLRACGVQHE